MTCNGPRLYKKMTQLAVIFRLSDYFDGFLNSISSYFWCHFNLLNNAFNEWNWIKHVLPINWNFYNFLWFNLRNVCNWRLSFVLWKCVKIGENQPCAFVLREDIINLSWPFSKNKSSSSTTFFSSFNQKSLKLNCLSSFYLLSVTLT